jgi:hypothetical protein
MYQKFQWAKIYQLAVTCIFQMAKEYTTAFSIPRPSKIYTTLKINHLATLVSGNLAQEVELRPAFNTYVDFDFVSQNLDLSDIIVPGILCFLVTHLVTKSKNNSPKRDFDLVNQSLKTSKS